MKRLVIILLTVLAALPAAAQTKSRFKAALEAGPAAAKPAPSGEVVIEAQSYSNGRPATETLKRDGRRLARRYYRKDGSLLRVTGAIPDGPANSYKDGKLYYTVNYKGGLLDGVSRSYYPDGALSREITYLKGAMTGPSKAYYRSGKLQSEVNLVNGLSQGEFKTYHENGQLDCVMIYRNGKAEGPSKIYNDKGVLTSEVTFVNDKEDGVMRFYHDNGALQLEKTYKAGVMVGMVKLYDRNGKLVGSRKAEDFDKAPGKNP